MNNSKTDGQNQVVERIRWLSIGLLLKVLTFFLKRQGKKDPWLGRALKEFEGVYKFESGDKKFCQYLVLDKGKISVSRGFSGEPDFKFTLYEPARMKLRARQEMVLEIVIGNKIGQSGNLYYLYQFGFIMSLLDRSFRKKKFKRGAQIEQTG